MLATALVAEAAATLLEVAARLVDLLNRGLVHLANVLALAGIAVTALALKVVVAHLVGLVGLLVGLGASAAGLGAGLLRGLAVALGIETDVNGAVGEAAAIAELQIRQKVWLEEEGGVEIGGVRWESEFNPRG